MTPALDTMSRHHPSASACPAGPVADWLEGQARLVAAWRDRLLAESGDVRLIALLDQHAAFLREARTAAGIASA
ncbi:hypothetical protein ACWCOP_01900 [Maricaulaceae bacterium MS644]